MRATEIHSSRTWTVATPKPPTKSRVKTTLSPGTTSLVEHRATSLLYEAVAQAFLDVGEELLRSVWISSFRPESPVDAPRRIKKREKSKYNKARVAFKGGGEMSCYQLCMTTLVGCPCV